MKRYFFLFVAVFLMPGCQTGHVDNQNLREAAQYNLELGLAYLQQNDLSLSREKLFLATRQNPDSAETWMALAYFFQKTHSPELAKKYYRKALTLAPDDPAVLNNMGAFFCQEREYSEGLSLLQKALKHLDAAAPDKIQENIKICSLLAEQGLHEQPKTG